MAKNFAQNAEDRSMFLVPAATATDKDQKGERADTSPFRAARVIDINRIQPDPEQPRKTFVQESLKSLAESIKELGGIIDPLTVEYVEKNDFFQIISGERRFRAAKMVGLETLPCIVKDVDEQQRFLMQFIANLQRENIPPLEEAAGMRHLLENMGYTQQKLATILNKSKSYVSQILGLARLSKPAREIVQTSELSKEVLIQASRENDPEKQVEILKSASEENTTVKEIRKEQKKSEASKAEALNEKTIIDEKKEQTVSGTDTFNEWTWEPRDRRFVLTIRFNQEQGKNLKADLIRKSLEKTLKYAQDLKEKFD